MPYSEEKRNGFFLARPNSPRIPYPDYPQRLSVCDISAPGKFIVSDTRRLLTIDQTRQQGKRDVQ